MKKLIALACGLSLAGCASMAGQHSVAHVVKPVHHAVVAKEPPPVVTVAPAAPVPPATFKMRWQQRVGKLRNVPFFHHKAPVQEK